MTGFCLKWNTGLKCVDLVIPIKLFSIFYISSFSKHFVTNYQTSSSSIRWARIYPTQHKIYLKNRQWLFECLYWNKFLSCHCYEFLTILRFVLFLKIVKVLIYHVFQRRSDMWKIVFLPEIETQTQRCCLKLE